MEIKVLEHRFRTPTCYVDYHSDVFIWRSIFEALAESARQKEHYMIFHNIFKLSHSYRKTVL
jgi:hypothetical protein